MTHPLNIGLMVSLGLAAVFAVLIVLVRWARGHSRGAVMFGALLAFFAPDPVLESQIRIAEQAKRTVKEEDEDGKGDE